jgi:hypothetical protein
VPILICIRRVEHQHNLNDYSAQQLTDQIKKADELFNKGIVNGSNDVHG